MKKIHLFQFISKVTGKSAIIDGQYHENKKNTLIINLIAENQNKVTKWILCFYSPYLHLLDDDNKF